MTGQLATLAKAIPQLLPGCQPPLRRRPATSRECAVVAAAATESHAVMSLAAATPPAMPPPMPATLRHATYRQRR